MFLISVELGDLLHLLVRQREVEEGDVLFLMIGIGRAGDGHYTTLEMPVRGLACPYFRYLVKKSAILSQGM